ncbi:MULTISPECIES: hypothetical protein [unclassified Spirosoma]|uniref:hypothetical protein n=1 Tax=unclassified Spirosoma TaxID=2621999 RepID=UPI00096460C9|nr:MULTISPECIES: hypothetical protein [unclassified Spirosoma]MBN8824186.1 hypothetical protein [Spirosoma sp.]OJW78923.1 MAG: hypothetical protein BGO59_10665 [Spirosoma sp. 48-14]
MKTDKYRQLTDVHLLHRIWRSELELALQEVNFWEDLLGTLDETINPTLMPVETWQTEISQLHHFRRLIKRLLNEIQEVNEQVALGVRFDQVLDKDTRLNHQYLREEMDSFHTDFRTFKNDIRQYLAAQPAL